MQLAPALRSSQHWGRHGQHKIQPPKPRGEAHNAGKFDLVAQLSQPVPTSIRTHVVLQEMREIQRETSGEIMAEALEVLAAQTLVHV